MGKLAHFRLTGTDGGKGSAIAVSSNVNWCYLLTNKHVAINEDTGQPRVLFADNGAGINVQCEVFAMCPSADLAVLRCRLPNYPWTARLCGLGDTATGQVLVVTGSAGSAPTEVRATVVGGGNISGQGVSIICSHSSKPGDSGGGVYRASDGRLVGVVWGNDSWTNGRCSAIDLARLNWLGQGWRE